MFDRELSTAEGVAAVLTAGVIMPPYLAFLLWFTPSVIYVTAYLLDITMLLHGMLVCALAGSILGESTVFPCTPLHEAYHFNATTRAALDGGYHFPIVAFVETVGDAYTPAYTDYVNEAIWNFVDNSHTDSVVVGLLAGMVFMCIFFACTVEPHKERYVYLPRPAATDAEDDAEERDDHVEPVRPENAVEAAM